ncbi:aldo/keto reductase [Streptomyces sp. LZ34]
MRSVTESLDRLGLDRVDVLHVHDPDQDYPTAVTEAYRALAELLPLCAERGVAVMAAGVYQSGLLADPRPGAP